ncbi:MAG: potassium channel family protein [Muribaculaceae bacterium]|nr:potassium channel family protein [Muribaculaceae bacterium]
MNSTPQPQPQSQARPQPAPSHRGLTPHTRKLVLDILHTVILILSVALIAFISYDTFKNIEFLDNRVYMTFQFFVCVVFMADFFIELWLTPKGERRRYLRGRWFFLLMSIPFLNIIDAYQIELAPDALYFARFLPLARGALALAIVLSYIASNRITGIFVSYLSIMILSVYFAGLIFYEREAPVNPGVTSYWDAFGWCCLEATTLGSSLNPMTLAGKLLAVGLSLMGVIMFPLFTVYLSSLILKGRSVLSIINLSKQNVKTDDSTATKDNSYGQNVAQTHKNS